MQIDILDLLETKNFEKLTVKEQEMVLLEMSESEYQERRNMIVAATILVKEEKDMLQPNPATLLMAQQKMSGKKKSGAVMIFQHKTPTWMTAAAVVLLLFGLWGMKQSAPETEVILETIHDTVYQEKVVTEQVELPSDTVVKYVYLNQPEVIYETVDNTDNYPKEAPNYDHLYFREDQHCQIMSCHEPKKGKSVAEDKWIKLAPQDL